MKLKNKYVLRTVADKTVAIAVENGGEKTDGVITLNATGAFIFGLINEGTDEQTIAERFYDEYEVSKEEAVKAVSAFVENLRNNGLLED